MSRRFTFAVSQAPAGCSGPCRLRTGAPSLAEVALPSTKARRHAHVACGVGLSCCLHMMEQQA